MSLKKWIFGVIPLALFFTAMMVHAFSGPNIFNLRGKFLLQVENNGEAWYINPNDLRRYPMGKPEEALVLMKKMGIEITNKDLEKIPINNEFFSGQDEDKDGIPDLIEDSLGSDKTLADTDGDSYPDKEELDAGYSPVQNKKFIRDEVIRKRFSGKILLQVEQNGEAWYVNPQNNERYFLGSPLDALHIMQNLGTGVLNKDLNTIAIGKN